MPGMQEPMTAAWGLDISDADFAKLRAGLRARDMDDRWIYAVDQPDSTGVITIHILRSWTSTELYAIHIRPGYIHEPAHGHGHTGGHDHSHNHGHDHSHDHSHDHGHDHSRNHNHTNVHANSSIGDTKIVAITWEQNKNGILITEEQAKIEVTILSRVLLECKFDLLPDYDRDLLWNHPAAHIDADINRQHRH